MKLWRRVLIYIDKYQINKQDENRSGFIHLKIDILQDKLKQSL